MVGPLWRAGDAGVLWREPIPARPEGAQLGGQQGGAGGSCAAGASGFSGQPAGCHAGTRLCVGSRRAGTRFGDGRTVRHRSAMVPLSVRPAGAGAGGMRGAWAHDYGTGSGFRGPHRHRHGGFHDRAVDGGAAEPGPGAETYRTIGAEPAWLAADLGGSWTIRTSTLAAY